MFFEKLIFYGVIALLFYPIILFYIIIIVCLYYGIKGKIDQKK